MPITAPTSGKQLGKERIAPQLRKITPVEIEVISFTRIDPSPEYVATCEGCTGITVVFSVTCSSFDGCESLSVMDFYVTYESAYPTLFYGDESPNPLLQDPDYAGIIHGMQKEFPVKSLEFGQTTIGEASFTVKPDASNFVFHYKHGHDDNDVAVVLAENNK